MVSPVVDIEVSPARLNELIRWHGTDESDLPPAHTLQNLSRDTVAALGELQRDRESLDGLRAAMGRAFWAADLREMRAILLDALGPPPAAGASEDAADHPALAPHAAVRPELNGIARAALRPS
ncbi:MAG TPA: hypothetical protein VMD03_02020 [Steroidobacteraceae bacterium]|nr:hypothetical protein [Steroidobacteraceae bacterium]